MQEKKPKTHFGMYGIALGSAALLLALVHFWAGPFTPQPTLETTVAEKAAAIRTATINALKGEEVEKKYVSLDWDADTYARIATAVLGGLAMIFGVLGFAKHESIRAASGAAALGISAIAFQFIAMYAMALLVVLLICAVLASMGIDIG